MRYKTLQEVIDAKLVEKCVGKYLAGYSQYVREEAVQYCWLQILESNPDRAQCLECWIIRIVKNQCVSNTSPFYKDILRYEKKKVRNQDGGNIGAACEIGDSEPVDSSQWDNW